MVRIFAKGMNNFDEFGTDVFSNQLVIFVGECIAITEPSNFHGYIDCDGDALCTTAKQRNPQERLKIFNISLVIKKQKNMYTPYTYRKLI